MASIASGHSEIVSAMSDLWTTVENLALLSDDVKFLRPPYSEEMFNAGYALEAGFSPEAVDVLSQLTYISSEYFEFLPSTYPICWVEEEPHVNRYRNERVFMSGLNEELMPPSVFKLSFTNIYEYVFLYDAATKLVHPWKPFESPEGVYDYFDVPGQPPREVFDPFISAYRRLDYIGPGDGTVDFGRVTENPWEDWGGSPPSDWTKEDHLSRFRSHAWEKAIHKIEDIYLECGWDVDAVGSSQPSFRRDEFIQRRDSYWREAKLELERLDEDDEALKKLYGVSGALTKTAAMGSHLIYSMQINREDLEGGYGVQNRTAVLAFARETTSSSPENNGHQYFLH